MATISRQVKQGRQPQGIEEKIAYTITTTPWGGTPVVAAFKAYDITGPRQYDDVTATVFPSGTTSVSGDVITLPLLQALTIDHVYRVECRWTFGGNTLETFFEIVAER